MAKIACPEENPAEPDCLFIKNSDVKKCQNFTDTVNLKGKIVMVTVGHSRQRQIFF